jgi:hypothetical protein
MKKRRPQTPEQVEKRISKIRGENHGRWKDGMSRRGYRKFIVKEKCNRCSSKDGLGIHHKDNDHFNNDPDNLEVVCNSCHMSEHKKAYWKAIKEGQTPPKSNGPVGWKFTPIDRIPKKRIAVEQALADRAVDLTEIVPDKVSAEIAYSLGLTIGAVHAQIHYIRNHTGIRLSGGAKSRAQSAKYKKPVKRVYTLPVIRR